MRKPGRPRVISGPQQDHLQALLDKRAFLRKQLDRLTVKALAEMFEVTPFTINQYAERHSESKRAEQ